MSHETISNITDAVLEEIIAWQARPLEEFYPVMFMDAIRQDQGPQQGRFQSCSHRDRGGSRRCQTCARDLGPGQRRSENSGPESVPSLPTAAWVTSLSSSVTG
ncbi:transposase [Schaalia sp. ZJ405]|nr:transposase [Schaalia sp. ZJ405]QPK82346.1 transposase [Schaalia sp. ZJ405]